MFYHDTPLKSFYFSATVPTDLGVFLDALRAVRADLRVKYTWLTVFSKDANQGNREEDKPKQPPHAQIREVLFLGKVNNDTRQEPVPKAEKRQGHQETAKVEKVRVRTGKRLYVKGIDKQNDWRTDDKSQYIFHFSPPLYIFYHIFNHFGSIIFQTHQSCHPQWRTTYPFPCASACMSCASLPSLASALIHPNADTTASLVAPLSFYPIRTNNTPIHAGHQQPFDSSS